jgi:hypothetical protein
MKNKIILILQTNIRDIYELGMKQLFATIFMQQKDHVMARERKKERERERKKERKKERKRERTKERDAKHVVPRSVRREVFAYQGSISPTFYVQLLRQ